MHWDSAVLPFTPGLSLRPPSDMHVAYHPCVSALVCAEQNNSSSLLGKALGALVVGSTAVSYWLYPLQMNPTVGTEVSELVSPHPDVLGFEGQPSVNEAFPLAEQPRDIWVFDCIMVHLCQNRKNGSEAGHEAPGLQGCVVPVVQ